MSRVAMATVAVFLMVLGALGAQAADIQDSSQAFDRFIALLGPAEEYSAFYRATDQPDRTAAKTAAEAGMNVTAGEPGWLFAAKKIVNSREAFTLGFVRPTGEMLRLTAKSLPAGMDPAPSPRSRDILPAVTTRAEAYDLLVHELLGHSTQGKRIWAFDAKIESPVTIKAMRSEIRIDAGTGWLFFIDDVPRANWAHPCRYVLVLEQGGMSIQAARVPPSSLEDFTELTEAPGKVSYVREFPAASGRAGRTLPRDSGAARPRAGGNDLAGDRYAVIISGGFNEDNNHIRYWNDCAFFYNTLMDNGFADENIYVLISDGTNPDVDCNNGEEYLNSPTDLDGDGDADTAYNATKASITMVFNELQGILDTEDILYIFATDHGDSLVDHPYSTPNAVLILWDEEYITDAEFAVEVNKVTTGATVAIFEQCYSGGMIDDLAAPNRVLMSASRFWEVSWASWSLGYEYDEFSYYVTLSLSDPGQGDSNGDGEVTMEEAYLYALANDSYQSEGLYGDGSNIGEHPSYYSNPWDLGRKLSLSGLNDNLRDPVYGGYTQHEVEEAFSGAGTAQGWQGDDECWEYDLPFTFPFGGGNYDSLYVCSNGHLTFDAGVTDPKNMVDGLKTAKGIAPLWDDLQTVDVFIAEDPSWVTIRWYAGTYADSRLVSVEAKLFPSGAIRFLYGPGNDHTSRVAGRDKTIGISLGDGQNYHLCLRNGKGNLGSANGIEYLPYRGTGAMPAIIQLLLLD